MFFPIGMSSAISSSAAIKLVTVRVEELKHENRKNWISMSESENYQEKGLLLAHFWQRISIEGVC